MKVYIGKYPKNPHKNRRTFIHIDNHDVWNMDTTLAYVILPMLKKMKELRQGSPFVFNEDVPESIRRKVDERRPDTWFDDDDNWHKRWHYILEEMIFAFENKIENLKEEKTYDPEHQLRIDNGFRLFGKYYESLWT